MDTLIVGAGLFGQVIAKKLRQEGHRVTVFDRREPEAGSPPSGGHLKPSWLSFLNKAEMERSFETLDNLYQISTLKCQFLLKTVDIMRVDVEAVLSDGPVVVANVTAVGDGWVDYRVDSGRINRQKGVVVVAAGVWSAQLLPQLAGELAAKKGVSWTFQGVPKVPENAIIPWAPYKQVVRTVHGPSTVWMGDGSAILASNWSQEREATIRQRIFNHVQFDFETLQPRFGLRPYMSDGFRKLGKKLWVATGGGKSGMCLAGVYANRLADELR